jgi:flagellar hook protein FlgE
MLRSLNSGVSGLRSFQTKLDVIGNNIANVNTVGFKKGRVVFEDVFSQTVKNANGPTTTGGTNPIQVGLGTKVSSIDNLFSPGSPTITNNSRDLYIDGDGFFVVQDANSKQYLTRAGNFTLDSDGQLVNPNGMFVLDQKGEQITIPKQYISFSISGDGTLTGVKADGTTENIKDPVGDIYKIANVVVTNPGGLKKEGGSLYSLTLNADPKNMTTLLADAKNGTSSPGQIIAGALEMSNVDLAEEMTDMITAQRGFQANAKIITVSDSVLEELVNLKR